MPDVAIPIFSNKLAYNGSATVHVSKNGQNPQILRTGDSRLNPPNASGLIARMETRFDDNQYYTA